MRKHDCIRRNVDEATSPAGDHKLFLVVSPPLCAALAPLLRVAGVKTEQQRRRRECNYVAL